MNAQSAENREEWNQQNAADADGADEQSDDRRHDRECEGSDQPAAKLVSSLVRSIVSRFITA